MTEHECRAADGGNKSRKFRLAVGTSMGIVFTAWLCTQVPTMAPMFDTIVGGLVGVLALYSGFNVGAKAALRKGPGE